MQPPSYLALSDATWQARVEAGLERLRACDLCPRKCGANRLADETGVCRVGRQALVSSYGPHFGEEPPLVGHGGSGTIFFTSCNLRCVFCQNYEISHLRHGEPVRAPHLAQFMLQLQARGCHNINLVTPTHVVPQILEALSLAVQEGLRIPIVYNCGGYESVETLKLLEGIVDIYMPDFKYTDASTGKKYSGVPDYPEVAKRALKEMHRQVGDLKLDERGIAYRGLLVRHLVMPNGLAGTREAMRFLAEAISPNTYVNVMAQYHPAYRAWEHPEISRRITHREYLEALQAARDAGLRRLCRG